MSTPISFRQLFLRTTQATLFLPRLITPSLPKENVPDLLGSSSAISLRKSFPFPNYLFFFLRSHDVAYPFYNSFSPLVQVFRMVVDTTLKVTQKRRNYLINLYIIHHLSKTTFLTIGLQEFWPHSKRLPKPVTVLMPTSDPPGSPDKNIIYIIHVMISLITKN